MEAPKSEQSLSAEDTRELMKFPMKFRTSSLNACYAPTAKLSADAMSYDIKRTDHCRLYIP
jgi:hypothetical protein